MNIERNCQSCKYYKDGYCENLELKPYYPQNGCDDFSKRNELKKDTIQVLDKIRIEIANLDNLNPTYLSDGRYTIDKTKVLQIIDKYKEESEDKTGVNNEG